MTFPPPDFVSFTIPSIHVERLGIKGEGESVELECRLYHPRHSHSHSHPRTSSHSHSPSLSSSSTNVPSRRSWRGAIVAHPYAPLGGCQDDPVVLSLVREILKGGDVVVGTFNFRGAPGSKGSTSWTGAGEVGDYMSVVGFMVYYLWYLRRQTLSRLDVAEAEKTPDGEAEAEAQPADIHLLLAGYSYGALITSRLPPVAEMLRPFAAPDPGSGYAEIWRRAEDLAERSGEATTHLNGRSASRRWQQQRQQQKVARGSEEPQLPPARRSHEIGSRRSIDAVRRSLEHLHIPRPLPSSHQSPPLILSPATTPATLPPSILQDVKPAYILVSPLLGPVSGLLTLFKHSSHPVSSSASSVNNQLAQHPSMVVYGDQDGFTSARRVRRWCHELALSASSFAAAAATSADSSPAVSHSSVSKSSGDQSHGAPVSADGGQSEATAERNWGGVTAREVAGAGHFWREEGAMAAMRSAVSTWVHAWLEGG